MTEQIYKITCSKCKEKKFVNPKALQKRILKYGSIENIEANWVCRKCINSEKTKALERAEAPLASEENKTE